jgi:Yip1 domain
MTPQVAIEKPQGEFSRIIGVYLEPKETFADIAKHPTWLTPMLIVAILSSVFLFCFSQRVGWDRMVRRTFETNTRMQDLPAEQRAVIIQRARQVVPITAYVGGVIGRPIAIVVAAGFFLLMFKIIGSELITFKQAVSVTSWAFLTWGLATILSIVTLYLKEPEDFDLQNPLAFNLGYFLSSDSASKGMIALASSIDLFSFWTLGLLATGFAACGRISWTKALIGVAIPWLLVVLLGVVRAAYFG